MAGTVQSMMIVNVTCKKRWWVDLVMGVLGFCAPVLGRILGEKAQGAFARVLGHFIGRHGFKLLVK